MCPHKERKGKREKEEEREKEVFKKPVYTIRFVSCFQNFTKRNFARVENKARIIHVCMDARVRIADVCTS